MRKFFARLFALIKKEFIAIWTDPKSRAFIVGMPMMQLMIFSNAITMEVRNIDIAVYDRCNSVESRELISRFQYSPRFRNVIPVECREDLQHVVDIRSAQLGLVIADDFSQRLKNGEPAEVLVVSDGRQTNTAAISASYANRIVAEYSSAVPPIAPEVRNWFNPNLEYRWYLVTILITLLSMIITLLLTALSIAREREMGTFDQLIVSPLTSFQILLGKIIPPLLIAMGMTVVMTIIIINAFKVPFSGSIPLFMVSALVALLAVVGVGFFISSICSTQQQAILGVMTFQMPAVLLSGFISPIEDMPKFWQTITWGNPVRFFMKITRGIFLKDMGVHDVVMNLIPLAIIAVSTLSVAVWCFKRKLE